MKKKGMAQVQETAGTAYSMTDEIPKDLLADLTDSDREAESIERESISYLQMCWRRLKKDKLAMFGIVVIAIMTLFAIFGPIFSPYTYDQTDFAHILEWPSKAHWFGTDKLGRDIFVRTMYGARISLTIGFTAAFINMIIGVLYVLGMFMETLATIIILVPVLLPMILQLGIDPIHFGIVLVVTNNVAMLTPPLGVNLFVASRIAGISVERISVAVIPYLIALTLCILLFTYVPAISTWLPSLMGYGQ